MANTEVDICNLALARVRANPIGQLIENSPQAEKCRIFYPEARDYVLSMKDWPFNKKTVSLSLKTFEPAEYTYAYDYPNDCLKIRYLLPDDSAQSANYRSVDDRLHELGRPRIEFDTELGEDGTRVIITDQPGAKGVYTAKVKDIRLLGQIITELIAYRLAMDLAIPLGGDAGRKYREEAKRGFDEMEGDAISLYLNERSPRQMQELPRSIRARLGRSSHLPLRK